MFYVPFITYFMDNKGAYLRKSRLSRDQFEVVKKTD